MYKNFGLFLSGMNLWCCVLLELRGTCGFLDREFWKCLLVTSLEYMGSDVWKERRRDMLFMAI